MSAPSGDRVVRSAVEASRCPGRRSGMAASSCGSLRVAAIPRRCPAITLYRLGPRRRPAPVTHPTPSRAPVSAQPHDRLFGRVPGGVADRLGRKSSGGHPGRGSPSSDTSPYEPARLSPRPEWSPGRRADLTSGAVTRTTGHLRGALCKACGQTPGLCHARNRLPYRPTAARGACGSLHAPMGLASRGPIVGTCTRPGGVPTAARPAPAARSSVAQLPLLHHGRRRHAITAVGALPVPPAASPAALPAPQPVALPVVLQVP